MVKIFFGFLFIFSFSNAQSSTFELAVVKDLNNVGAPSFSSNFENIKMLSVVGGIAKLTLKKGEIQIPVAVLQREGLTPYDLQQAVKNKDVKQLVCETRENSEKSIFSCQRVAIIF